MVSNRHGASTTIYSIDLRGLARSEIGVAWWLLRWWAIWVALLLFLAGLVVAYQSPRSYTIEVGQPSDEAYVKNFHARLDDNGISYRWSDVYGYVALPGLGGSRPFTITIMLDTERQSPVKIFVNGEEIMNETFSPGWRSVTLRVDSSHPQALQSRDTVIELRSTDYRTEDSPTEPKGVKVSTVTVGQDPQGGLIIPAVASMVWLLGVPLLFYLFVGRALAGSTSRQRARLWALIAALLVEGALLAFVAASPVAMAAASGHFVVTLLSALAIAVLCEMILRVRAGRMSALQCRMLALALAGAFLLRFGGMGLPQSVIIDMPWHMKWLGTLLTGDWAALYLPGGGLNNVPAEWGLQVVIPKSPLFYVAFAPLSILPFDLEQSAKWLICLLDASLVLAVFRLSLAVQARVWAGVAGAWLYAVMPLAFRAFAYGILPTILAQWLATALFLAIVLVGVRRWRPLEWVALVGLALLAFLSFPTVALFASLVAAGYAVGVALWRGAGGSVATICKLATVLAAGWLLAIVLYYGLYISPVLASAQALLAPRAGQGSTVRWPGGLIELVASTGDYVVTVLPALLAVAGLALLFVASKRTPEQRRALLLLTLWLAIGPVFVLVNYKMDMIGKHLFFTMLPVALAGGILLFSLGRGGRWRAMLAALVFAVIGWQGLVFWVERLVRASS